MSLLQKLLYSEIVIGIIATILGVIGDKALLIPGTLLISAGTLGECMLQAARTRLPE